MNSRYLIFIFIGLSLGFQAFGQNNSKTFLTTEFKVYGLCGLCKERIENAALIKGVKKAEWNKETGVLKVILNPEKVKPEDIHKAVAAAGHDTDLIKADDKIYKKLPKCCAYRDSNEKH